MPDHNGRLFGSGGSKTPGPYPGHSTGPIGGGKLTGVGGGELTGFDGGKPPGRFRRLDRGTSGHGRDGSGRGRTRPNRDGRATGGRPSATRRISRPVVIFLSVLAMGLLFQIAAIGFVVLRQVVFDQPSDGGTVDEEWDIWTDDDVWSDTVPGPDVFDPGPGPDDGDPTKDSCVDSATSHWSGTWASNRGTANGWLTMDVGASGTTVNGVVALGGSTPIPGGPVRGEIHCRVLVLDVFDSTTGEPVIGFTGIISADGSSIRGSYSAMTNAGGSMDVLDEGSYSATRS